MPKFVKTQDRRFRNSTKMKKCKTSLKVFFKNTDKTVAQNCLNILVSMLDKLAGHNIIHANKAGRLKSKCYRFASSL
ncbi:MAG: 30S ribosomal protein S20 [Cytophagales bacterium]|jgi:small subunit ribosomal protein S20|nr:30S ribosomal protein S20 [Cytophagales bacterium]